ncbi:MAG: hypothetical protein ACFFDT_05520 [Candidatus Hodarchaeota archaeon]
MALSSKLLLGFFIIISTVGAGLFGSLSLNQNPNQNYQEIILDDSYFQTAPRDPYTITFLEINGDLLTIKVSYGGGNCDHEFILIGSGIFMESYPVQTTIVLSHNANGDLAEKLIREHFIFDLSPLIEAYQRLYLEISAEIVLHFEGVEEPLTYRF